MENNHKCVTYSCYNCVSTILMVVLHLFQIMQSCGVFYEIEKYLILKSELMQSV